MLLRNLKGYTIAEVVNRCLNENIPPGKIKLQKLVFFLERLGIPLDYRFEMYHYGPYSFELAENLDTLNTLKVLDIQPQIDGYGYSINASKYFQEFLDRKSDSLKDYESIIDFVIENFASKDASKIELLATIHFVEEILNRRNVTDRKIVVEKVKGLKPKFTSDEIEKAYEELKTILSERPQ